MGSLSEDGAASPDLGTLEGALDWLAQHAERVCQDSGASLASSSPPDVVLDDRDAEEDACKAVFATLFVERRAELQRRVPDLDDLLMFVLADPSADSGWTVAARRWVPGATLDSILGAGAGAAGDDRERPSANGNADASAHSRDGWVALGPSAAATMVSWQRSVALNLVVATPFVLTALVCPRAALLSFRGDSTVVQGTEAAAVVPVYASPWAQHLDVSSTKRSAQGRSSPDTCYPSIAFAVEEFDVRFESLVTSAPDSCYCVLISADAGWLAPAPERAPPPDASATTHRRGPVLMFSGFVVHDQLEQALLDARARRPVLSMFAPRGDTPLEMSMRGPGGVGGAQVAVSFAGRGGARSAGAAAKSALNRAGRAMLGMVGGSKGVSQGGGGDIRPVQCALMSAALPCSHLALGLLAERRRAAGT